MKSQRELIPDSCVQPPPLLKEEESILFKRLDEIRTKVIGEDRDSWFTEENRDKFRKFVSSNSCSDSREAKKCENRIVLGLCKFVVHLINKYPSTTVSVSEQFQEGMLGVLDSVYKYDTRINARFLTYASWHIRSFVSDHRLAHCEAVKIPVRVNDIRRFIRKNYVSTPEAEIIKRDMDEKYAYPTELSLIKDVINEPSFIYASSIATGHQTELVHIIPSGTDAYYEAESNILMSKVLANLSKLNPNQFEVIKRKYGLNPKNEEQSNHDIGIDLKLSRERIRQVDLEAISLLRNLIGSVNSHSSTESGDVLDVKDARKRGDRSNTKRVPGRRVPDLLGDKRRRGTSSGKNVTNKPKIHDPV